MNSLNLIKNNYTEFSKYTMQYRTYPSLYDGCKIAQRRVLYAAYAKAPVSKKIKASSMLGLVMQLHPHSEATEVLTNIGSPHKTAMPMFNTQGNWGDNYGNPPSASRYLECCLNDTARKLYFSLIDQAPFENFEVEEEPLYLPTLFPLALLQGCFSVGQGTPNPLIPDLQFEDLKKYVMNYIKTGETKVSKDNFVRLVDYDKIRNDSNKDNSVCELLNTGKGNIYFAPTIERKDNMIIIKNLYVLAQFSALLDRFKEDIQADKIDIRDESGEERVWVIEKVKNKVFDMDECVKIIKSKFTYKENFCMYFHDDEGRVKPYSLGEIISACYSKYKDAYSAKINKEIDDWCSQRMILECLAQMAEHTDIVTNNKISDEEKIKELSKVVDYNEYVIGKALQKPISYLKKDEKAIKKAETEIKDKQSALKNISKTILSEVEKL